MLIRALRPGAVVVLVFALLVPSTFPQLGFAQKGGAPPSPPPPPPAAGGISSVASGGWSNPAVWSCACLPTWTNVVTVNGGHAVTVDTAAAVAQKVIVNGTLKASRSVSSVLTVAGNLIVQGSGVLDYGTPADRIPASVVARVRFLLNEANYVGGTTMAPLDSDVGLWVVGSSKFTTAGPVRDGWALMTASAPAGSTAVTVDSGFAKGWRPGDFIAIGPSTAVSLTVQPSDGELRSIAANPSTGTFTFVQPLAQTHTMQTVQWVDAWGASQSERLAPPVANLSRNIVFDAVNPAHRPHMMAMGAAVVQIEDAAFVNFSPVPKNLGIFSSGRPKPMARYAIHFHGQKAGSQSSYVKRAVVTGGAGNGITIHDSYGVVLEDVVVYNQARAMGLVATYPIYLEGTLDSTGAIIADTGANRAWIDRALLLGWGSPQSVRAGGVWAQAGVAAYVVGLHCAGGQGKFTSCMHWHNTFPGDSNGGSQWPVIEERQPRLLRGTAHSMIAGFSTWQNPGPGQDMVDLLAWNNQFGVDVGAYRTDRRFFALRAIGNSIAQISQTTFDMHAVGFLADGQGRGGVGIVITHHSLPPTVDALYDMGVVRGVNTAVTFADCLQNVFNPCGSTRSFIQFSRTRFEGDPEIRFIWHPIKETRLRFRNQTGLARPTNFTLYRKDQTVVGGVLDAEYEAIRVNDDAASAASKPPMINLASFAGCASDGAVVSGLATLCVETDAPVVEFWAGGTKFATVSVGGLSAQATFSLSAWPYSRAYVYAKAIGSNGRVNYSRVLRLQKSGVVGASATQP